MRIDGTRITVSQIVALHKQGHPPEYIVENCPYLNLAHVYAALAYYHANQKMVDIELTAEDEEYERLKGEHERSGRK